MQLIYNIRHGETEANVNGQVNDKSVITPINKKGKLQSIKTGKYLKKEHQLTNKNCIIYSSPSIRAFETAELIAKELGIKNHNIIKDERINELDHGLLSGSKESDSINKQYMIEFNKLPKDPIKLELSFENFDKFTEKKFKTEPMLCIKKE
jgi:probable phosphoglycerate mutase